MLDKRKYSEYLAMKKTSEKLTAERLEILDHFNSINAQNEITDITAIDEEALDKIMQSWNKCGLVMQSNNAKFLSDYIAFIKKENPTQQPFATLVEAYIKKDCIARAKVDVSFRRLAILPLPAEYKVNSRLLGELDNDEFSNAFKELHQLVIRCYDDIERAPFEWGYPDYKATDGYYNRVMNVLFAIVFHGNCMNGKLIVDGAKFFADNIIKRHKKIELMISGFGQMGLCFEGFGKKAQSFRVSYPDNPHVMTVLCAYVSRANTAIKEWAWGKAMNSLSYRYIEDPATQPYHQIFLAEMDYASDKMREIQQWLYHEAEKYGYTIDPNEWGGGGGILYKKGSKKFLNIWESEAGGVKTVRTKTSFIKIFEAEPKQARILCNRFPHIFNLDNPGMCCGGITPDMVSGKPGGWDKRCPFRMYFKFDGVAYLRCGLGNFTFENISFDDVKVILDMFLLENKIKPFQ